MRALYSLDLVLLAPHGGTWYVCAPDTGGRGRAAARALPTMSYGRAAGDALAAAARQFAGKTIGATPRWLSQVGAFTDAGHPTDAAVSVGFVAVYPDSAVDEDDAWVRAEGAQVPARQKAMIRAAMLMLRHAVEHEPVAFHALPAQFTLRELQQVYELLLARRLHKASFRRALHAAHVVEPTKSWRTEGRGRPAQLFKFAPRRRRLAQRGVRFDVAAA
jgi:8-oxo-dGTP diphosphatase